MIPIVTIVAFTFMGIEGIAEEIEMPFGLLPFLNRVDSTKYQPWIAGSDDHDLPLGMPSPPPLFPD